MIENVAAFRPSSRLVIRVGALLLGVLLLGPVAGARAQGLIQITKAVAGRCNDPGPTCEWRLVCKIGDQPETELIKYWEAKPAAEMELNQAIEVPKFPVSIQCKLQEDDGVFGKKWYDAGTVSMELPGGGDFEVEVGNAAEGAITLSLRAASVELTEPVPAKTGGKTGSKATPAKPRLYAATFAPEQHGHAVVLGLPWDQFKARLDKLAALGSKPVALISYEEGGQLYWGGIFHAYDGDYQIVHGLQWDPFFTEWKKLTKMNGMRLSDFEVWRDKGKIVFTGLYEAGTEDHNFRVGLPADQFAGEVARFAAHDVRLTDLEVYEAGGRPLYAGAFRSGIGSYGVVTNLSWDQVMARQKKAQDSGSSIGELESHVEGGKRLWDITVSGSSGELTPPLPADQFIARWKEMVAKGLHMTSIETYR
jgi:hypothetical protein